MKMIENIRLKITNQKRTDGMHFWVNILNWQRGPLCSLGRISPQSHQQRSSHSSPTSEALFMKTVHDTSMQRNLTLTFARER